MIPNNYDPRFMLRGYIKPAGQLPSFTIPVFCRHKGANELFVQVLDERGVVVGMNRVDLGNIELIDAESKLKAQIGEEAIYVFVNDEGIPFIGLIDDLRRVLYTHLNEGNSDPLFLLSAAEIARWDRFLPDLRRSAYKKIANENSLFAANTWRDRAVLLPIARDAIRRAVNGIPEEELNEELKDVALHVDGSQAALRMPRRLFELIADTSDQWAKVSSAIKQAAEEFDLAVEPHALLTTEGQPARLSEARDLNSAIASNRRSTLPIWIEACRTRWEDLTSELPNYDLRRCPHGRYIFAYEVVGMAKSLNARQLRETAEQSVLRYTGWPPFWVPNRSDIGPYVYDNTLECWLGRSEDRAFKDAAHSDFWRLSKRGEAFLLRGFQEDGPEAHERGYKPGRAFDLTLPIWRTGEALLHAERLAHNLDAINGRINFTAIYSGLKGRELVNLEGRRFISEDRIAHQNEISLHTSIPANRISDDLVVTLQTLLEPLYELFDTFELSSTIVKEEVDRLRGGRF